MCRVIIAKRFGLNFSPRKRIANPIPKSIERNMHMFARVEIALIGHWNLLF